MLLHFAELKSSDATVKINAIHKVLSVTESFITRILSTPFVPDYRETVINSHPGQRT